MRILFLGDVTGKSGRAAVIDRLGSLKAEYSPDFTIVNGENSAHGKGITGKIYRSLKAAGADVITLGNHAFSKKEILNDMDGCPDLVRPLNMEPLDAGSGWIIRSPESAATRASGAGVATHSVVEGTVRHAADIGFDVMVAQDACAAADPGRSTAACFPSSPCCASS